MYASCVMWSRASTTARKNAGKTETGTGKNPNATVAEDASKNRRAVAPHQPPLATTMTAIGRADREVQAITTTMTAIGRAVQEVQAMTTTMTAIGRAVQEVQAITTTMTSIG